MEPPEFFADIKFYVFECLSDMKAAVLFIEGFQGAPVNHQYPCFCYPKNQTSFFLGEILCFSLFSGLLVGYGHSTVVQKLKLQVH